MGNGIARDIHCDVTMSHDIVMCTSQWKITLLWTFCYVITTPTYDIAVSSQNFTIAHINH